MNKLKFFKTVTWILIVINISILVFFYVSQPKHHGFDPKNIQRELSLSKSQHQKFIHSANKHRTGIHKLRKKQRQLVMCYFGTISKGSVSDTSLYVKQLESIESEKLKITYIHFKEIKAILNKKQSKNFNTFMHSLMERIVSNKNGPRRPIR